VRFVVVQQIILISQTTNRTEIELSLPTGSSGGGGKRMEEGEEEALLILLPPFSPLKSM